MSKSLTLLTTVIKCNEAFISARFLFHYFPPFNGEAYLGEMICPFLFTVSKKGNFPMSAPAFDQKTNPNLTKFQVEQTLPSEENLKREIEQFINEDYQGSKGIPFRIIITAVICNIIFGAIWLAWL
jgi:hypothetical protein